MSVSCKTIDSSQLTVDSFEVQKFRSVDTVVVRDSVFVSEKQRGDTVYLTRVEWRDRWRTRMVHDTIVRTDSIVQVIELSTSKVYPIVSQVEYRCFLDTHCIKHRLPHTPFKNPHLSPLTKYLLSHSDMEARLLVFVLDIDTTCALLVKKHLT